MRSPKEISVEQKLIELTNEIIELTPEKDLLPLNVVKELIFDSEVQAIQDYANTVSIVRLGFNDHGPVHMRTVCRNCLKMLKILYQKGIKTSLENEQAGTFSDSVTAVILASFLHDFGMTIGRQDHELYSGILALPVITRILAKFLPSENDLKRKVTIRSMAMEGILGHMGTRKIHSIEAGLILIADGCDMTKGRARIPMELNTKPSVGDIHKYSANSIESVKLLAGENKPIKIEVKMSADVGFFQIEEVLLQKINSSPAKNLVELYAGVEGKELKKYL
ncbi:MAG: phosphohydrolase [Treponema sp.]|nr:phosphohydrolase [Spirochaetia bacterium]MDD7014506.1 phosphohydrolase [Spirochaetales bacterium]MDY4902291.1 phosphohydrolase [Treponema sp.]